MNKLLMLLVGLSFLLIPACQSSEQQAVSTVQAYLQALVTKDETDLLKLTCPDWQMDALLEFDAYGNVGTTLKDLACQQVGADENSVTVHCSGSIEASYQNEIQSFDLGKREFRLVNQGGDWLVCGN